MDDVENLILEQLRTVRASIDQVHEDMREVKSRLTSIEQSLSSSRRDTVQLYGDVADQHARFDRLAERVERIERRLELRNES